MHPYRSYLRSLVKLQPIYRKFSSDSSLHIPLRLTELRVWSSYGWCVRMQAFKVFPCIRCSGDCEGV